MVRDRLNTSVMMSLLMTVGLLTACGAGPADNEPMTDTIEVVSSHTARVDWEKNWESAFSRAKNEGKPVLVSFEAEWCVWCKKLDSTTYRDSAVMSLIAESLVPLTLDVDKAGSELSDEHGVESLPTVLVFSPDGQEQGRINGYLPPGQFIEVMKGILQQS